MNHTNSVRIRLLKPRLECFHSIDSCSTQPHETWVISHDYTEAHSPIKPGLGSLSFNSSPNPKHTTNFGNFARNIPRTDPDSSGYTTLSSKLPSLTGIVSRMVISHDRVSGMGYGHKKLWAERPIKLQYISGQNPAKSRNFGGIPSGMGTP